MALWGNQAILIQEEVTKLEKICDQQLGPDLDSLDKQRTEVKVSWTDRQTDRQIYENIYGPDLDSLNQRRTEVKLG